LDGEIKMKLTREQYIDLIGRWVHGCDGFIHRLDVDKEYDDEEDVISIWVNGEIIDNVGRVRSIEDNRVQFGDGLWIDLNDNRKELDGVDKSCAICLSQCKREEICSFFDKAPSGHNYNEVHKWNLHGTETYEDDKLAYWWDVPNE